MFDAREWLTGIKEAARIIAADNRLIEARRNSALSLAAPIGIAGRGGAVDRLGALDVALDLEATRSSRLEYALKEIAEAQLVFEGMRTVGVLENDAANVLELETVYLFTQKETAAKLYVSLATVKRRANYGVDWLNAHGLAHAKTGTGRAT